MVAFSRHGVRHEIFRVVDTTLIPGRLVQNKRVVTQYLPGTAQFWHGLGLRAVQHLNQFSRRQLFGGRAGRKTLEMERVARRIADVINHC